MEGGGRALSLDAPLNDDPDADTLEAVIETYRRYFRAIFLPAVLASPGIA